MYPRGTREVPERYPRGTREIPERYPRGSREVPERYPRRNREIPEKYPLTLSTAQRAGSGRQPRRQSAIISMKETSNSAVWNKTY